MKMKSLLFSAIVSAISVNAFALEIYKGRIVSHKEWTTGNGKAIFKMLPPSSNMFALKDNMSRSTSGGVMTDVGSTAEVTKGTVGSPVAIKGRNYVTIVNLSNATVKYYYTFSICGALDQNNSQCAYYMDQIELEPQGKMSSNKEPSLQLTYVKPGTYSSFVSSYVSTLGDENFIQQTTSSSNGLIEITEATK